MGQAVRRLTFTAMLDVLTLVSVTTPALYLNECRRSVQAAIAQCDFPVRHIESPGVPGHIGAAMRASLATSSAQYVCWVDDDDLVLPNAFTCLQHHFAGLPAAVCAREILMLANGRLIAQQRRHHLSAFHREVVDTVPLDQFPGLPNLALLQAAQSHTVVDEMSWVYLYRLWRSAGLHTRAHSDHSEWQALS